MRLEAGISLLHLSEVETFFNAFAPKFLRLACMVMVYTFSVPAWMARANAYRISRIHPEMSALHSWRSLLPFCNHANSLLSSTWYPFWPCSTQMRRIKQWWVLFWFCFTFALPTNPLLFSSCEGCWIHRTCQKKDVTGWVLERWTILALFLMGFCQALRLEHLELIFIRFLHLLAHHPDFAPTETELLDMASYVWALLLSAVSITLDGISIQLCEILSGSYRLIREYLPAISSLAKGKDGPGPGITYTERGKARFLCALYRLTPC